MSLKKNNNPIISTFFLSFSTDWLLNKPNVGHTVLTLQQFFGFILSCNTAAGTTLCRNDNKSNVTASNHKSRLAWYADGHWRCKTSLNSFFFCLWLKYSIMLVSLCVSLCVCVCVCVCVHWCDSIDIYPWTPVKDMFSESSHVHVQRRGAVLLLSSSKAKSHTPVSSNISISHCPPAELPAAVAY